MSITKDKIKKHKNVATFWTDEDGHWAKLCVGLKCASADTHTCHAYTLARLLGDVRDAIPCKCDSCIQSLQWKDVEKC